MAIKEIFTTAYFIDTRTVKKSGKHPVKIRLYDTANQTKKLYATRFDMTKAEFESVWATIKPRSEHKSLRREMEKTLNEFNEAAEGLSEFSFDALERIILRKAGNDPEGLRTLYNETIDRLKLNKQFGTASNYKLALQSILKFHGSDKKLEFSDITVQWLTGYEMHMEQKGRSRTTVSMYLRTLRTVFNQGISEKIITPEQYPFGRRKYVIPSPKAVKKALSSDALKVLFEAIPATPEQAKAKDFWFLSYACNGANVKDILNWKWSYFDGQTITFERQKTSSTKKDSKPIVVFLNEYALKIIEKYGNPDKTPDEFMFPILSRTASPEQNFARVKNFTRFINQNLLKLAKQAGINEPISTYWARHTFATTAIRKGASLEFIGDALGHSDTKTTIGYFAGFESEAKKQFSQSLMEF
jgi:integrase/recombinase XerD